MVFGVAALRAFKDDGMLFISAFFSSGRGPLNHEDMAVFTHHGCLLTGQSRIVLYAEKLNRIVRRNKVTIVPIRPFDRVRNQVLLSLDSPASKHLHHS